MRLPSRSQTEQLNSENLLNAHRVSADMSKDLAEASLELTRALFPDEPDAATRLREAYNARILGHNRVDDFETLEYFTYTLGHARDQKVIGAGGVYRLVEDSPTNDSILEALRNNPPASVSFLRAHERSIHEFVWGGRLCIEPASASSPGVVPFILLHILSTAQAIIRSWNLAPVLLAFTRRHENDRVRDFYQNLGFENLGISLSYAEETQDVFCLNMTPQAPVINRLKVLTTRLNR